MRIKNSFGEKDLDELMARLNAARASTDGRSVQWHGFPGMVVPILESAIDFQDPIPESDRRQLIEDAVHNAATEAKFDRVALIKQLKSAEIRYLQEPLQRFIFATSWTAPSELRMKRLHVSGARISFSSSGRIRLDRDPVRNIIEQVMPLPPPPRMLQVRAHITARTPSGAVELGRHAVDYARGVRNYVINRGSTLPWFPLTVRLHRPINKLLPGPIHTIHTLRGKLAEEKVWYELYPPDHLKMIETTRFDRIEKVAEVVHRRVKDSFYQRDIQHAFVRYTRALDSLDHATAFTRLWTTLEYLADTSEHERLIRRIAFLTSHEEKGFIDIVLRHVRDVRNSIVHRDATLGHTDLREGIETYLYQLKVFAEWLLNFHLRAGRKYKTRAVAAELLDTPTDKDELRRRIGLYKSLIRHRS